MAYDFAGVSGPNTVFCGSTVRFEAQFKGEWPDEAKAEILWRLSYNDEPFAPVVLLRGPTLAIPLPRARAGAVLRVQAAAPNGIESPPSERVIILNLGDTPYPAVGDKPLAVTHVSQPFKDKKGQRRRIRATVRGRSFFVGRDQRWPNRRPPIGPVEPDYYGVGATLSDIGPTYPAAAFAHRYGHWAWMLEPTLKAEGKGSFSAINTYDKGRISFGLVQFALHTPDKNLVVLLRDLLGRPEGRLMFPMLKVAVVGGKPRICDRDGKPLESSTSTDELCELLNPGKYDIDDAEVDAAARLIYWVRSEPEACDLQVRHAIELFRGYLAQLRGRGIHHQPDVVCAVAADILNHGRWKLQAIERALEAKQPYQALLDLDRNGKWADRAKALNGVITRLKKEGCLGKMRYNEASGEFEKA
jgi:hypothetical protein